MTDSPKSSLRTKWRFAWGRQRGIILMGAGALIVTTLLVRPWSANPQLGWWQWMEAICGVATLAVALIVWWGELTENWEHELPKRLRVVFLFEGKPVMVCDDAPLISENDIRAMAQQIGSQMNGGNNLKLHPILAPLPPVIEHRPGIGPVRCYEIRMTVSELPSSMAAPRNSSVSVFRKWQIRDGSVTESLEPG